MQHVASDGHPVEVGRKFWNNDLRVCEVTEVAKYDNKYADTGCTQTWHETTHGSFDTLNGTMAKWGRLVRYFEGRDAEQYEPGTNYADIKES
jgi:hypothetical protein